MPGEENWMWKVGVKETVPGAVGCLEKLEMRMHIGSHLKIGWFGSYQIWNKFIQKWQKYSLNEKIFIFLAKIITLKEVFLFWGATE
jgi:hypothetical protein